MRSLRPKARDINRTAPADHPPTSRNLADAIHRRFKRLGGIDIQLPKREPTREPPKPK